MARMLFPPGQLDRIIEPRFSPQRGERRRRHASSRLGSDGSNERPTKPASCEPVAAVSWLEMRTYMASTLLRDTDAVSHGAIAVGSRAVAGHGRW